METQRTATTMTITSGEEPKMSDLENFTTTLIILKTVLITNKSNRKEDKSDAPAADGEGGGVYRHGKTRYQYTKE